MTSVGHPNIKLLMIASEPFAKNKNMHINVEKKYSFDKITRDILVTNYCISFISIQLA